MISWQSNQSGHSPTQSLSLAVSVCVCTSSLCNLHLEQQYPQTKDSPHKLWLDDVKILIKINTFILDSKNFRINRSEHHQRSTSRSSMMTVRILTSFLFFTFLVSVSKGCRIQAMRGHGPFFVFEKKKKNPACPMRRLIQYFIFC